MSDNNLRIKIYSSGTTVLDTSEYSRAQGLNFRSYDPVGFGECSFFLPGDPTYLGRIAHKMIVAVYNGFRLAWAGRVTNKRIGYDKGSSGIYIDGIGHFGDILTLPQIRKPWAENRLDEAVWRWNNAANGAEKMTVDRTDRLRITPKNVVIANNELAHLILTTPTGLTWKRVTFSYDFAEVGNWKLALDNGAGTNLWNVTATGTGTQDIALGANASNRLLMYFQNVSGGNLTPASDGTVYGQLSNIVAYTETGGITPTEIIKDVLGYATEFSTDVSQIASNTTALVPFVADPMSYAAIVAEVARFGDSSGNAYTFGVRSLDATNKPILYYEAATSITDYDYIIRLTDQQLEQFEAEQNVDSIRNYIAVSYQDANGRVVWITPDDDASLTDATSVAAYDRRDEWISLQTTSAAAALQHGQRVLAAYKDLQWRGTASIPLVGTITKKSGEPWPVSLIMPGQRLKIGNYLNLLNGNGLTLRITGTDVKDDGKTVTNTLTVGNSDALDVSLALLELPARA